jgi:hypothetical protein
MPQKQKEQPKSTPAPRERSSDAQDLREDCLEELGQITSEVRWIQERIDRARTLPSGEKINRRITRWRKETKSLIGEYAAGLVSIFAGDFEKAEREAEILWPLFNEKAKSWVSDATLAKWQRLALAQARRRIRKERPRRRVVSIGDPRKMRVAMFKRKYSGDASDNQKMCAHLDLECVSVVPEWRKKSWREAWADKAIRRYVSRYLSGIRPAKKEKH